MASGPRILLQAIIATLTMLLYWLPASASLVSVDVFAPGDGLATYDTETGYSWLDYSVTWGQPGTLKDYLDGNSALGNQLKALGFDIAGSAASMYSFMNHAGATVTSPNSPTATLANQQALDLLTSLGWLRDSLTVSDASTCGSYGTFSGINSTGLYRDLQGSQDPYDTNGVTGWAFACSVKDQTATFLTGSYPNSNLFIYGTYPYHIGDFAFVKAVPLPAAAWLFGGALGALGILKRRARA